MNVNTNKHVVKKKKKKGKFTAEKLQGFRIQLPFSVLTASKNVTETDLSPGLS